MKLFIAHIVFAILFTATTFAGGGNSPADSTNESLSFSLGSSKGLFERRKTTALFYSIIMPGSGQTMLGSPYKGFSFTFVGFGSALTILISHNNFVASNERLDALEFQYRNSTTWESSNAIYHSLNETYAKVNKYKKMRNTFAIVSAVVWTVNIADVIFFTEDEGESVFSMIHVEEKPVNIAGNIVDRQHQLILTVPLQ